MTDPDSVRADLERMVRARRYVAYQYRWLAPHLAGRRVLEVGTGIGALTEFLLADAAYVIGIEPDAACFDAVSQRLGHWRTLELHRCALEDLDAGRLSARGLDTVLCVNVLEHLEDDRAALRSFARLLPPGGRLVLVVPAIPWAYGPIDRAIGHHRRYSARRLRPLLRDAGFQVHAQQWFNPVGLVGWIVNAKLLRITRQSDRQIRLFDRHVVPWQEALERRLAIPVGQSLLLVAERAETR